MSRIPEDMLRTLFAIAFIVAVVEPQPDGITLDGDSTKPMPLLGFGTCCRKTAKGAPLIASTKEYLAQGGRLIDTAQMYGNHRDLGFAIRASGIPREHIWLTSKVNTKRVTTKKAAFDACVQSAQELGVEYIDLMLIHGVWTLSAEQAADVWRGLIDAKAAGKVRHIGVSNFERSDLEKLISATGVKPAVHQLEYHPFVPQGVHQLVSWCQEHGIAVTAYGSLGSSSNRAKGDEVAKVAQAHGVSSAALLLRWALNRGVAVIPGATSAEHIRENLALPEVKLSTEEIARISSTSTRPSSFKLWGNLPSEYSASLVGRVGRLWGKGRRWRRE